MYSQRTWQENIAIYIIMKCYCFVQTGRVYEGPAGYLKLVSTFIKALTVSSREEVMPKSQDTIKEHYITQKKILTTDSKKKKK